MSNEKFLYFFFLIVESSWPDNSKHYRSNVESPRKNHNKYLGNRSQLGKFQSKNSQFTSFSCDEKLNQNSKFKEIT